MQSAKPKPASEMSLLWRHWLTPPGGDSPLPAWQRRVLTTLEWVYRALLRLARSSKLARQPFQSTEVRVIAIGNLIVGGAGKTPCSIALANGLSKEGLRVGLLTRGYRSQAERSQPTLVVPSNLMNLRPEQVGDEAWLLAWRTERPVAVCTNRKRGLEALRSADPSINVVILDDGLAQRSLAWHDSLLLIDGRGFGNGHCLPNGPLREPAVGLNRFTAWIDNGFLTGRSESSAATDIELPSAGGTLSHAPESWIPLSAWRDRSQWLDPRVAASRFKGQSILAVAGIAVPQRFFEALRQQGLEIDTLAARDHDPALVAKVIARWSRKKYDLVLMTEKDAVKFFHHDSPIHAHAWALRLTSTLEPTLIQRLANGPKTA